MTNGLRLCAYRSAILHGAATVDVVLSVIRRDLQVPELGHETMGIVNLVIVGLNVCGVEQTRQIRR
jgi:hypothetical protein